MSRLRSMNNTEASQTQTTEAMGEGGCIMKLEQGVRELRAGAVLLLGPAFPKDRDPTNANQAV